MKIVENDSFLQTFDTTREKSLSNFCWDLQFRVVQRRGNLADLDKRSKMTIQLQKIGADTAENEPSKV